MPSPPNFTGRNALHHWVSSFRPMFKIAERPFLCVSTRAGKNLELGFLGLGPSIKYVTLFFANFYPSPCHTSSHIPGSPEKYVTHFGPPSIFRRPSTKNPDKSPLYKFCLNCSRGFLSGGLLSGVVFVCVPVLSEYMLHQKVTHHFKFHVSYV